jgi:hypothetical protein
MTTRESWKSSRWDTDATSIADRYPSIDQTSNLTTCLRPRRVIGWIVTQETG